MVELKENNKRQKGITLIALVVTIVVLLILASISIQALTGDNGIITQAQKAKYETDYARETETIELAKSEVVASGKEITKENLQSALDKAEGTGKTRVEETEDGDGLEITFIGTNYKHNEELSTDSISEEEQSYWTYRDNDDGTVTLLKYNPPASKLSGLTELVVPNKLHGKKVKGVGKGESEFSDVIWGSNICVEGYFNSEPAGYYNSEPIDSQNTIRKIIIQKNIKEIGKGAFINGFKLEEIELNSGLTKIGDNAFYGCRSLTSVKIPAGVKEIGYRVFGWCSGMKEIYIPKGVVSMGEHLFYAHGNKSGTGFNITVNMEDTSIPTTWNEHWNEYWIPTINYGVSM